MIPEIDYRRLLDDVPLGIMILDRERRVVFYNKTLEAIIGLSADDAAGLSCFNVLRCAACLSSCRQAGSDPQSPGEPTCTESDLINRDRQRIPVRVTTAPIFDLHQQAAGFVETIEDLRPLKEHEEVTGSAYSFGPLIGKSSQMEKLFRILPVIAQSDASVLITGETGTGKDMLAEALHQASPRAKGPFVKINCGALPETLLESELFGHVKGAFTGAVENKLGRFHLAHNGTLYLTEIGDLPQPLQVKLLTFLDDKIVFPLGSNKGFEANVRVIAATHRNLEAMVKEGTFRQDLFFRLNVLRVHIPPLREREGDVRLLLDFFLNMLAQKLSHTISGYSVRALKILMAYDFPGNVRELRNIVEYGVNMCQDARLLPKHLPAYIVEAKGTPAVKAQEAEPMSATLNLESDLAATNWPATERRMIMQALVKAKGNRSRTAEILGWARSTLWRKMKQHGIDAHEI